mmetsp:Transcript_23919/g.71177  ORF Transcript_23919/g.71177 Transcript_23919/m.71177 type:complete len:203 (+) Transcript_23919:698-1306(+)
MRGLLPTRGAGDSCFELALACFRLVLCLKSCWICAAGRETFDAIFVSCHFLRRSSMPQDAFQETCCRSSGVRSTSTATALSFPRTCCSRAIAVTSSTPAGTSPTSVCCRWRPSADVHQLSLPIGARSVWLSEESQLSPLIWRTNLSQVGSPSAIERKPVRASLRTDQMASVFQGAVRPCSGRIPGSKVWPSSTGPMTSVSLV